MAQAPFDFDLLVRGGFPLQRFEVNTKIFVQDDAGTCMYVVRSGKVGIMASGAVLENIGPNGTFTNNGVPTVKRVLIPAVVPSLLTP